MDIIKKALISEGYWKIVEVLKILKRQVSLFCRRNNINCMN